MPKVSFINMSVLENPFRSSFDVAKRPYDVNMHDEEYKVLQTMFECNTFFLVFNVTRRNEAE